VEAGGTLRPKTIGMFMESGLNASLVQKANENRIFVGGLAENTTDQSLKKYFEPYGAIDGKVTMDPNHTLGGRNKGFGFVTFKDDGSLQDALCVQHVVDGKAVDCRASVVKGITENRHNKCHFFGMDTWRKEVRGTVNKAMLNGEVMKRTGSRLASTEEWKPTQSRKNALSLSYTTMPTFSATA